MNSHFLFCVWHKFNKFIKIRFKKWNRIITYDLSKPMDDIFNITIIYKHIKIKYYRRKNRRNNTQLISRRNIITINY